MSEESGYTLIEMLVVAMIVGVFAVIISNFYADGMINYARNFTNLILLTNTKLAAERVATDVRYARGLENQNGNPDNNAPGAPGNLYSWASDASTLVLATPAKDTAGNIIYADGQHNAPKTDDTIYYLKNNILYRRLVANADANNAAKTTCPPEKATASCLADPQVIENIASMSLVYYDTNENIIISPPGAYSVKMTLQESKTVFGKTYSNQITAQATLRNK